MIHLRQPADSKCCGQTCVAMVLGKSLAQVCEVIGHKGTQYTTLRKAAAAFGATFGSVVLARHHPRPDRGHYIARIILRRKPHLSHFVVLRDRWVLDPAMDEPYQYIDWIEPYRRYWDRRDLTLASWVEVISAPPRTAP